MDNLINQIPEILEKSTNLFSFFALIIIVVIIIGLSFYGKGDKKDKNRAFYLILLFLAGMVIVAFIAGNVSGIQIGSENKVDKIEQNPSLLNPQSVELPLESMEKLENYITAQNKNSTAENKIMILEEALESYINSQEQNTTSRSTTTSLEKTANSKSEKILTWTDTTSKLNIDNRLDQDFSYICPSGGTIETVYGTDVYNHSTSICTAAVHSGIITAKDGGLVTIRIRPREESYAGTYRNEVESRNYGKSRGSFIFLQE